MQTCNPLCFNAWIFRQATEVQNILKIIVTIISQSDSPLPLCTAVIFLLFYGGFLALKWDIAKATKTYRAVRSKLCNSLSNNNLNSVARVRERTIPIERPPLVGEVSANFCG
jgi:hypothetical protein